MRCAIITAAVCALLCTHCNRSPAEPAAASSQRSTKSAGPRPLTWQAPPTWSLEKRGKRGKYRAKYQIAPQGDDKQPAELLITKLPGPDPIEAELDRLEKAFEKQPTSPKRQSMTIGSFAVTTTETHGTYRLGVGPVVPGSKGKRQAAYVLQPNWRALAAGVHAGPRGRWFFQLVGPSDTVEAARSPMLNMIKGLK